MVGVTTSQGIPPRFRVRVLACDPMPLAERKSYCAEYGTVIGIRPGASEPELTVKLDCGRTVYGRRSLFAEAY
jgi:hypothetical protein